MPRRHASDPVCRPVPTSPRPRLSQCLAGSRARLPAGRVAEAADQGPALLLCPTAPFLKVPGQSELLRWEGVGPPHWPGQGIGEKATLSSGPSVTGEPAGTAPHLWPSGAPQVPPECQFEVLAQW